MCVAFTHLARGYPSSKKCGYARDPQFRAPPSSGVAWMGVEVTVKSSGAQDSHRRCRSRAHSAPIPFPFCLDLPFSMAGGLNIHFSTCLAGRVLRVTSFQPTLGFHARFGGAWSTVRRSLDTGRGRGAVLWTGMVLEACSLGARRGSSWHFAPANIGGVQQTGGVPVSCPDSPMGCGGFFLLLSSPDLPDSVNFECPLLSQDRKGSLHWK